MQAYSCFPLSGHSLCKASSDFALTLCVRLNLLSVELSKLQLRKSALCLNPTPRALPAAAAKLLQSCPTLCDPMDCSPPGSCPWDSPGENTGVGCHFLLQGIYSNLGIKPESPTLQADFIYCLIPQGSQILCLYIITRISTDN